MYSKRITRTSKPFRLNIKCQWEYLSIIRASSQLMSQCSIRNIKNSYNRSLEIISIKLVRTGLIILLRTLLQVLSLNNLIPCIQSEIYVLWKLKLFPFLWIFLGKVINILFTIRMYWHVSYIFRRTSKQSSFRVCIYSKYSFTKLNKELIK